MTRPDVRPARVRVAAPAELLARAAAACAARRVPVDAALGLCAEVVAAGVAGDGLAVLAARPPATAGEPATGVPPELRPWWRQLVDGAALAEDTLPTVWVGEPAAGVLASEAAARAVALAGDALRLAIVLDAERMAVERGGQRLGELVAAAVPR